MIYMTAAVAVVALTAFVVMVFIVLLDADEEGRL